MGEGWVDGWGGVFNYLTLFSIEFTVKTGDDLHDCIHVIQEDRKNEEGGRCFTHVQRVAILHGVSSAVEHLQSLSLVHCDIKPSNVMFNV